MSGKTGGVVWRVHVDRVVVSGEELPRVGDARHCVCDFYRRSDVRSRHETRPSRAQKQIEQRTAERKNAEQYESAERFIWSLLRLNK